MLAAVAVIIRLVTEVSLMGLFGILSLTFYAPAAFKALPHSRLGLVLTLLGFASGAGSMMMLAAQMSGDVTSAIDRQTLGDVASGTAAGLAIIVRLCALGLGLVGLMPRWDGRRAVHMATLALAGLAVVSLTLGGHAAAGQGILGIVRLTADGTHLLAASLWLGALVGFLALAWLPPHTPNLELHDDLKRFSGLGSILVAVLVVTGGANTVFCLVGSTNLSSLNPVWGGLLLAKLVLFAGMLSMAALNRFRLTPALIANAPGEQDRALSQLRRSLTIETSLGVLVLIVVAILGMLAPLTGP